MKKFIKKFFRWIFSEELDALNNKLESTNRLYEHLKQVLGKIDVSVDVNVSEHRYAESWAVISIQGKKADFIKFVNLGSRDIFEIQRFLEHFDRVKADCAPQFSPYLRIPRK
jgi:Zn-dependent M16 (insulinase) family peptidase